MAGNDTAVFDRLAAYTQKSKDRKSQPKPLTGTTDTGQPVPDNQTSAPKEEEKPPEEPKERAGGKEAESRRDYTTPIRTRIMRLPTPGSISLPFTVVLLLLFMVQQINGKSRAEWSWGVLTGQVSVLPANSIISGLQNPAPLAQLNTGTSSNLTGIGQGQTDNTIYAILKGSPAGGYGDE